MSKANAQICQIANKKVRCVEQGEYSPLNIAEIESVDRLEEFVWVFHHDHIRIDI